MEGYSLSIKSRSVLSSKAVCKKIVSHPMSTSTTRKRFLDDDVLKLVILSQSSQTAKSVQVCGKHHEW
jgi:hypothetical protein